MKFWSFFPKSTDYTLVFIFTAFYADEATDKLILALRGVDEEIAYSMKWLYAQKTDPGKRIESCEKYADMWNARPALLEVASNNGNAQKQLCDELQASRKYIHMRDPFHTHENKKYSSNG